MDLQAWVTKGKEKLRSLGLKEWAMILIVGICCLIIVFPAGNESGEGTSETEKAGSYEGTETVAEQKQDYVEQLEEKLSGLLSTVENVGKVKVMITVSGTGEKNVLQDGSNELEQITEMDSNGGTRSSISEKKEGTTVFYDTSGENRPYIISESYPEVIGVVVIAEGSGTGTVDLDIMNAVQVLFDVPAHKIKIMKMK